MIIRSTLALLAISLTSVLASADSQAAKPTPAYVMGLAVDCHGRQRCSGWTTNNFSGQKVFGGNSGKQLSLTGLRHKREGISANRSAESSGDETGSAVNTASGDNDNGHGNDPGHVDNSNPGNSSGNQQSSNENSNSNAGGGQPHDDNGNGNDGDGNPNGNSGSDGDNGHGNDPGKNDSSNPGQGKGK